MYGYDFKDYVPGLNANMFTEMILKQRMVRKIMIKCDSKLCISTTALKRSCYIRIDYNVKHGNDFGEDRSITPKSFN